MAVKNAFKLVETKHKIYSKIHNLVFGRDCQVCLSIRFMQQRGGSLAKTVNFFEKPEKVDSSSFHNLAIMTM
ncbi:MAG TPA: hypothetical protein DEQ24_02045 [Enterococcus sp.]|nr:hypothetical protein [Enterococcus sp.]